MDRNCKACGVIRSKIVTFMELSLFSSMFFGFISALWLPCLPKFTGLNSCYRREVVDEIPSPSQEDLFRRIALFLFK